jgi:hypothetical protein
MLNIPSWNYVQHMGERMYGDNDTIPSATDILNRWALAGIVRSEEGYDGEKETTLGKHQPRENVLNFCVYGYTNTFQVFGSNVTALTKCWVICKKEHRPPGTGYILDAHSREARFVPAIGRERTDRPFQLSFYANSYQDYPPDHVLQYKDEHGRECRGVAIYIGLAEFGARNSEMKIFGSNSLSVGSITAQPQHTMLVNPKNKVF